MEDWGELSPHLEEEALAARETEPLLGACLRRRRACCAPWRNLRAAVCGSGVGKAAGRRKEEEKQAAVLFLGTKKLN